MKHYLVILFFLTAMPAVYAQSSYTPVTEAELDTLFKNEAEALEIVDACYNIQKAAFFSHNAFPLLMYGLDDRMNIEIGYISSYEIPSDDNYARSIFNRLFTAYNFCNKALAGLPYTTMDADLKNRLIGEVKFSRAFLGFYAYHLFRDFPMPEDIADYAKAKRMFPYDYGFFLDINRWPVDRREAIKTQIESDLADAIDKLPATYTGDDRYRATQGAAYALLGKHKLYQQDWQGAADAFQEVIDLGVYALSMPAGTDSADYVNAYLCNFTSMDLVAGENSYPAEFNDESIYDINFYYDKDLYWNQWLPGMGTQGSMFEAYFSPIGYRNAAPTANFIEQFETALLDHPAGLTRDPRLSATVFSEGDIIESREGHPEYNEAFDALKHCSPFIQEGYGLRKYCYPIWTADDGSSYQSPKNWRMIRYADVLLMYAEALYHLGEASDLTQGLALLNQVRNRAGMPAVGELTKDAIMHERDVELGYECVRFMDLVRWAQLPEPWFDLSTLANFTVGEDEFLPTYPYASFCSSDTVPYNSAHGIKVGTLGVAGATYHKAFTYRFVASRPVGFDNDAFYIDGDTLYVNQTITKEIGETYTLNVMTEDHYGQQRTHPIELTVVDEVSVGINKFASHQLDVYPNPARQSLNIKLTNDQLQSLSLQNLNGQEVKTIDNITTSYYKLDTQELPAGIYLLHIIGQQSHYTKKISIIN